MEVIAWKLLALLATAVSVLRNEKYAVCALPSGRERKKGVFWQLFRPKKLPSGAAAIRRLYLPEIEKVLLKNANFLKKFSFVFLTWSQKKKFHLFVGTRSEK